MGEDRKYSGCLNWAVLCQRAAASWGAALCFALDLCGFSLHIYEVSFGFWRAFPFVFLFCGFFGPLSTLYLQTPFWNCAQEDIPVFLNCNIINPLLWYFTQFGCP